MTKLHIFFLYFMKPALLVLVALILLMSTLHNNAHSLSSPEEEYNPWHQIPNIIYKDIFELERLCLHSEGILKTPVTSPDIIQKMDLNGDDLTDYIIMDHDVDCALGASFRNGNGGSTILIYLGNVDDGAVKAFEKTVWDAFIDAQKKTVNLLLGGKYCGSENSLVPKSEITKCIRSVIWNKEDSAFELGVQSIYPAAQ